MIKKAVSLTIFVLCLFLSFQLKTQAVSGKTGDLTWEYDTESCSLSITGNGEMENFPSVTAMPWYSYISSIRSVSIGQGVRSIGTWAFANCSSLSVVKLTDSTESIGKGAFYNCPDLVKVMFKGTKLYRDRITVGKYNEYFLSADTVYQSPEHVHKFSSWNTVSKGGINKAGEKEAFCSLCGTVRVTEEICAVKSVSAEERYFFYTGKANDINLRITDINGEILTEGQDYTVNFTDKINFGKHKATVVFKGDYEGTYSFYYCILPATVTNVKASPSLNSITLSWDAVKGADGYRIYVYDAVSKSYSVLVRKTAAVKYEIKNLTKGKNYAFLVRAYSKYNDSYYYSRQCAKIITCTMVDKCSVLKVAQSTDAVTFTWNKVAGATGYRVFLFDTSAKTYTALETTTGTIYRCEKLKAGKVYIFALRAYKKAGSTVAWSDTVTLTTATKPAAPTSLKAVPSINLISLSWKSSQGATGYRIYSYDFANKKYVPLKVVTATKVTFTSLTPGRSYVYLVRPYIAVGDSVIWGNSAKVVTATEKDSPSAVFVSSTGSKYHREGCSRAKNATEKVTIDSALKRGYTACSYCF